MLEKYKIIYSDIKYQNRLLYVFVIIVCNNNNFSFEIYQFIIYQFILKNQDFLLMLENF